MTGNCPRHGDFNSLKGHCELCSKEIFLGRRIEDSPESEVTLRDEFAMTALNGMLASTAENHTPIAKNMAAEAYRFADAMLEARKVKP